MKKLLAALIVLFAWPCWAEDIQLAWDAYTGEALGFVLYAQHDSGYTYTKPISDIMVTSVIFPSAGFPVGGYDFWLTAYNSRIESAKSNVVHLQFDAFEPPDDTFPVPVELGPITNFAEEP